MNSAEFASHFKTLLFDYLHHSPEFRSEIRKILDDKKLKPQSQLLPIDVAPMGNPADGLMLWTYEGKPGQVLLATRNQLINEYGVNRNSAYALAAGNRLTVKGWGFAGAYIAPECTSVPERLPQLDVAPIVQPDFSSWHSSPASTLAIQPSPNVPRDFTLIELAEMSAQVHREMELGNELLADPVPDTGRFFWKDS